MPHSVLTKVVRPGAEMTAVRPRSIRRKLEARLTSARRAAHHQAELDSLLDILLPADHLLPGEHLVSELGESRRRADSRDWTVVLFET